MLHGTSLTIRLTNTPREIEHRLIMEGETGSIELQGTGTLELTLNRVVPVQSFVDGIELSEWEIAAIRAIRKRGRLERIYPPRRRHWPRRRAGGR